MSCAVAGRQYRWGSISISRCCLLLWNSRKIRTISTSTVCTWIIISVLKKNPWWKEYPSLSFTTDVKPQEQKEICNFLELQVMNWENEVPGIGNYLYVTSLICSHNMWWELLHYSQSCSTKPVLGSLSDAWSSLLCRDCPEITCCQSTLRSITIFFLEANIKELNSSHKQKKCFDRKTIKMRS